MEGGTLEIEQSMCSLAHLQSGSGKYQEHFVCGFPYGKLLQVLSVTPTFLPRVHLKLLGN